MNIAKLIEKALATVIREHCNLPDGITIRAWQSLDYDATFDSAEDRTFPLIEIRASPPRTDDNQSTLAVESVVVVGTQNNDDKTHAIISDIYGEVQSTLDALFASFRTGSNNDEYLTFFNSMAEAQVAGRFNFGGFSYGAPLAPFEDRGAVMLGITLVTHYSRDDF